MFQNGNLILMQAFQCHEAIQNCIGVRAGRPLRDYFKIIRRLAWKKAFESQKPYEPKSKYKKKKKKKKTEDGAKQKKPTHEPVAPKLKKKKRSARASSVASSDGETSQHENETGEKTGEGGSSTSGQNQTTQVDEDLEIRSSLYTHDTAEDFIPAGRPFPYRPLQRYTTNIKNYMAEKYLDSLYLDKIFLETLKTTPGVGSPNAEGTKKILHMCKNGFKALSYKQVKFL